MFRYFDGPRLRPLSELPLIARQQDTGPLYSMSTASTSRNELRAAGRGLLEKLTQIQLVKTFMPFVEQKRLLACSQKSVSGHMLGQEFFDMVSTQSPNVYLYFADIILKREAGKLNLVNGSTEVI